MILLLTSANSSSDLALECEVKLIHTRSTRNLPNINSKWHQPSCSRNLAQVSLQAEPEPELGYVYVIYLETRLRNRYKDQERWTTSARFIIDLGGTKGKGTPL